MRRKKIIDDAKSSFYPKEVAMETLFKSNRHSRLKPGDIETLNITF